MTATAMAIALTFLLNTLAEQFPARPNSSGSMEFSQIPPLSLTPPQEALAAIAETFSPDQATHL
jgi:hypothetical protein